MITKTIHLSFLALLLAAFAWGCGNDDDTGGGGDADADADTDGDTDTDFDCSGDGVWYDATSDLCWQDPPSGGGMNWYRASGTYHATYNPDTVDHCGDLDHGGHADWLLPNIDELISLIRGCQDGTATGDLSPSACEMIPPGCAETDSCGDWVNCSYCSSGSGPASGCYWDPALGGTCSWYWSSSSYAYDSSGAWYVYFDDGFVNASAGKNYAGRARCVRGRVGP